MKREAFDEHFFGEFTIQFFEPRLWRLGARLHVTAFQISLALPTLAIRKIRHGSA